MIRSTTPLQPVQISAEAYGQIVQTLHSPQIPPGYGLRVGVRGGGCGAAWLLGFDQPGPADEVYNVGGVPVIIDKKHLLYVLGVVIGFAETGDERGFTVEKPAENTPVV
jgi:iron-sulfur cluster assembly protein